MDVAVVPIMMRNAAAAALWEGLFCCFTPACQGCSTTVGAVVGPACGITGCVGGLAMDPADRWHAFRVFAALLWYWGSCQVMF